MSLISADCSLCGYHRKLSEDILRSYQLDEQTQVTIPTTYGWCEQCAAVTVVEELPTSDKIAGYNTHLAEGYDESWRKHLENLRRWRTARTAPAKCLECGSTHFLRFEEMPESECYDDSDEEYLPVIHPGCGGRLTVRRIGFSRSCLWIFYTPEGDKLATHDVYFSRGLVPRHNDDNQTM